MTALAPAKVNLVLEVTGVRPDGYHEIDTVLQTLDLADTVSVDFDTEPGVSVSGRFADGTPADESNLAWRAAALLAERCGRSVTGLRISLEKRIPPAGGLGGGASDAVAVLRLLQKRWRAHHDDLIAVAHAIGSDEAFFLVGGTARARGRGEQVEPLPALPRQPVVLYIPEGTLERKTARMFAALDRHPFDDGRVAEAFAQRPPGPIASGDVYNAFERVAFDLFPGLAELWRALEERAGEPLRLAGAGPTLFWIGDEARAEAAATAGEGLPCAVIATATSGPT